MFEYNVHRMWPEPQSPSKGIKACVVCGAAEVVVVLVVQIISSYSVDLEASAAKKKWHHNQTFNDAIF